MCQRGQRQLLNFRHGAAAGVHFSIEDAVRPQAADAPDWSVFAKFFESARGVTVSKEMSVPARFGVFADVCEKELGGKARSVLTNLGLPE